MLHPRGGPSFSAGIRPIRTPFQTARSGLLSRYLWGGTWGKVRRGGVGGVQEAFAPSSGSMHGSGGSAPSVSVAAGTRGPATPLLDDLPQDTTFWSQNRLPKVLSRPQLGGAHTLAG